jgi:hypothetical protein
MTGPCDADTGRTQPVFMSNGGSNTYEQGQWAIDQGAQILEAQELTCGDVLHEDLIVIRAKGNSGATIAPVLCIGMVSVGLISVEMNLVNHVTKV